MNPLQKHKAVKNAAILAKCFVSGVWNNSDFVSKQFERVGTVFSSHLKSAGYTTFARDGSSREIFADFEFPVSIRLNSISEISRHF